MSKCNRCNRLFEPEYNEKYQYYSRCCKNCGYRNLMDFLDIPTPPELLDKYTKIPCLSKEEYNRKMKEFANEVHPADQ